MHFNYWEHDNPHGLEPPDDNEPRLCEHGKTMTEPCEDCDPPESLITSLMPILTEQQIRR
jgi:hypothetical protein